MKSILIPNISLGIFKFNDAIKNYVDTYNFEISAKDESGYEGYSFHDPETSIFVEGGIIVSVASYKECIYRERNMIGMSLRELLKLIKIQFNGEVDIIDFEEDNVPQYVYDFETLGLQIWIKGAKGKVVTVISTSYSE